MRLTALTCLLLTLALPVAASAETPLSPDSPLDAVLDALNARGKDLKDFSADVALHTADNRTGEDSAQIGKVIYDAGNGNSRIKVSFDKKETEAGDGKRMSQKQRLDYVLENGWLTDRDYQKKLEVRRQVLRPNQKMNLLKLGEGPFPLPIGQDKADVHKMFEVSKLPAGKDDPPGTIHARLKPNPGTQFEQKFKTIDVWIDPASRMPVKIETVDPNDVATRTTELKNIRVNTKLTDDDFKLSPIDEKQWDIHEQ